MAEESSWYDGLLDKVMSPSGIVALGSLALGGYAASKAGDSGGGGAPSGYQGGIPSLTAVRQQVPGFVPGAAAPGAAPAAPAPAPGALPIPQQMYDPNRRPGSSGRRYFSDIQYVAPGSTQTGTRAMSQEEALAEVQKSGTQEPDQAIIDELIASSPQVPVMADSESVARQRAAEQAQALAQFNAANPVRRMAEGGITTLREGRYLNGDTDGMADKVPASIEGRQPALLSDGEFVIPADVVSHLGNGNSEAGAKVLKEMLARIRKERTGNAKQGKQINPDNIVPA